MLKLRICLAGGGMLAILSGCGSISTAPATLATLSPNPTSRLGPPRQAQELRVSGELTGEMTQLAVDDPTQPSECTGPGSRQGGTFAWTFRAYLGTSVYALVGMVRQYRGPGVYPAPIATVELSSNGNQRVWQTPGGGSTSITIDAGELTGSVNADLDNLATNQPGLHIEGRWDCRS
jgi:hypothetical protein